MRSAILTATLFFCLSCGTLGHLRRAESSFREASESLSELPYGLSSGDADSARVRELLDRAMNESFTAFMFDPALTKGVTIYFESLFILGSQSPQASLEYSIMALDLAKNLYIRYEKDPFADTMCYYLAKSLLGSNNNDLKTLKRTVKCAKTAVNLPDAARKHELDDIIKSLKQNYRAKKAKNTPPP